MAGGNVSLAVESYVGLSVPAGGLDLTWTLDERPLLSRDIGAVIAEELADEARQPAFVDRYFVRDPYGHEVLSDAVAAHFDRGQCPDVTCGAGVNALLWSIASLTRRLYVMCPSYPDLPHWVGSGGGICSSRRRRGSDHAGNALEDGADVVLVERPGLDGETVTVDELESICRRVAPANALVIVDESYANYYPSAFSAIALLPRVTNLVVLRGLSKGYGLGGLRLGYACSSGPATHRLRGVVAPMLASSLSLRIARAVLALGDVAAPLRARVAANRPATLACLQASGLCASAAAPNVPFVFLRVEDGARLEGRGVFGKCHAWWADRDVARRYRLSVPLAPERLSELQRKVST